MALGDSAGEPGFGFLTDQHLQTLSREVDLALGDSAGEAGFDFLTDQHLQTLSREVGIELARVHWLWEHLGRQPLHSVQLLQDPTSSQGGHSQGVICSGRSPAPERLPAPAETADFSS